MEDELPPFLRDGGREREAVSPPAILDERRGYYFVTERKADSDNGDSVWQVSPLDPAEKGKDIFIRVPRHDPDRPNLLRVLSDHWEKAKLHLVLRDGSDSYEVLAAEPTLKESERAVHDDLGHAYTWGNELDETVDQYFHHKTQEYICHAHQYLLDTPAATKEINAQAALIFAQSMKATGDSRPEAELAELYETGVTPTLEGAHQSYADMLIGRQLSDSNEVEKVFYDPSRPYSEQASPANDPTARATAIANYAAQRAAYEKIHGIVCHTEEMSDGTRYSLLKKAEHELVDRKILFGFHPTRTDDDYYHLTSEFSSRLSVMALQGAMRATGSRAASAKMDHVTPTPLSPRGEDGSPYTIQSYFNRVIMRSGMPSFADHDAANGDPRDWLKRYNAHCLELTRVHLDHKEKAVAGEMDRAMAPGRSKTADWDERMNRRLHALTAGERAFMGFFEALEDGPEIV